MPTCIGVAGLSAFRKVRSSDDNRSGIRGPSFGVEVSCSVTLTGTADSGLRHWLLVANLAVSDRDTTDGA
ncbi:hypothetical protein GCM10009554_81460 [Kribbella koreensis]|uniref:Uncharacterized protein n=1 Tax=Kribbella koreensis TaxID=57909 RepID=A0ABN1RSP4_9ACTN